MVRTLPTVIPTVPCTRQCAVLDPPARRPTALTLLLNRLLNSVSFALPLLFLNSTKAPPSPTSDIDINKPTGVVYASTGLRLTEMAPATVSGYHLGRRRYA